MKRKTADQSNDLTRRNFLKLSAGGCAAMTSLPLLSTLLNLELTRSAAAATPNLTGYKAMVCVFLFGGYDAYNVLVPYEQQEYDDYASIRGAAGVPGGLAIARDTLLPIPESISNPGGRQFGIHPGMPEFQQLYSDGKLAFVANAGSLVEPTDLAGYQSGQNLPAGLFSHNDSQRAWQTCIPQSRQQLTGWGGRMADVLTDPSVGNSSISMNIALNSINTFQSGDTIIPYVISQSGGAQVLQGYGGSGALDRIMTRTTDEMLAQTYKDLISQTHAQYRRGAIDAATTFNEAIEGVELNTVFPPSFLGSQLNMIARIIAARDVLGFTRQIFFAFMGGWDHHANLLGQQANMLPQVSTAVKAFCDATEELGIAGDVTTFSASDFGRTLATNGNGSDHAWGNNQFVVGNGVDGGNVFGEYPTSLALGNPLDTGRGRLIPTTSVSEYAAELAMWFGIPNDGTLETVLPNIRNFYAANAPTAPVGFMT